MEATPGQDEKTVPIAARTEMLAFPRAYQRRARRMGEGEDGSVVIAHERSEARMQHPRDA